MDIFVASLLSGIVGVGISAWYYQRHEKRKQRFEVLRKIVGARYVLTENATNEAKVVFFSALNEIFVLYHDNADVIKALKDFHCESTNESRPNVDRANDSLVSLFKAMCKDLNVKFESLNDDFFLRPFSPRLGS